MATSYGVYSTLVKSEHIYAIGTTGGTILEQGNLAPNGGFSITFRHDLGGCGGPDSGIWIEIADFRPWTKITWEWLGTGTAACWSFNNSSGFGTAAGPPSGYLQSYNPALGDNTSQDYLTWEEPQFQSHDRTYACDNDSSNFFRYNGGEYKRFYMNRRRDTSGNRAGVFHGRSCNSTGVNTIIRNIFVY